MAGWLTVSISSFFSAKIINIRILGLEAGLSTSLRIIEMWAFLAHAPRMYFSTCSGRFIVGNV